MLDEILPPSYQQLYGEMVQTFLSRKGIPAIKVASPVNALFAPVAQLGAKISQGAFSVLAAGDLNRARGSDLDAIGEKLGRRRQRETAAVGEVTVVDATFEKVASTVYQGLPAPVSGSTTVSVADAAAFPSSGSVYLGRGTRNYEGPLAFTAKADAGTHWQLTLAAPTTSFHNLGESVIVAGGGDRSIPSGTVVQTSQGNAVEATKFAVQYTSVLPDGEVELVGVRVVAQRRGVGGNVPAGAVTSFPTPPFSGASVSNPQPFASALATQNDEAYREDLRTIRQSDAMATDLAVTSHVTGVSAPDEATTARSASVVHSADGDVLYVDDGSGYEEKDSGVPFDALTDSAIGGELDLGLSSPPVAKASVTSARGPFAVAEGSTLSVEVGGALSSHSFALSDFRDPSAATAQEISASVNGDPGVAFAARTAEGRNRVVLTARAEVDDDIEVVPSTSNDANAALQFPVGRHSTLHLYLNDAELSKDGRVASILSEPQSAWGIASGSQTLQVSVDGTPAGTYTISDADFSPSYATLASSNSLTSWAAALEAKVPGISVSISGDRLQVSSNAGKVARAGLAVSGGTLVGAVGMFSAGSVSGRSRDYILDRNAGEVHLLSPLQAGDSLVAGMSDSRAAAIGSELGVVDLAADAAAWVSDDGAAVVVPSGLTPSSTVSLAEYVATPPVAWGKRVRVTAGSGTPFSTVQVGDWAIHLDANLDPANRGAWRVALVGGGGAYYEVERSSFVPQSGTAMSGGGIAFARTDRLQRSSVPAGSNYTASSLASALAVGVRGLAFDTFRTTRLRVRAGTFGESGDVAVVAVDNARLGLPTGAALRNGVAHRAAALAAPESGTPQFDASTAVTAASGRSVTLASASGWNAGQIALWRRSLPDVDSSAPRSRFGPNFDATSSLESLTGAVALVRRAALQEYLPSDRIVPTSPYAFGAEDGIAVVVDRDFDTKRYEVNLFRRLRPTTAVYSSANEFTDLDAGGASLAASFGLDFDFSDYAALMRARAKSHAEMGDTTKTILWRYAQYGASGNAVIVRYVYPATALSPVSVQVKPDNMLFHACVLVEVSLPAGARRSGIGVRNSARIGILAGTVGANLQTHTYVLGFAILAATRNVVLAYTGRGTTAFSGTLLGGTSGATGTVVSDSRAGGTSGPGSLRLSGVTGSFAAGEAISATTGAGTSSGGQTGETILTLDVATPGAADHGLIAGDVVWIQGSGSYSSGTFTLTAATSPQATYVEGTTSAAPATFVGTLSADFAGESTLASSTVVAGDVAVVGPASGLPAEFLGPVRAGAVGPQHWGGNSEAPISVTTTVAWYALNDALALSFFPIDASANRATQIAASVNALAASSGACPITAVAVGLAGVADGHVALSGYDEFTDALYGYRLADGVNWVHDAVQPITVTQNYTITFKVPVTASLASNSDWGTEEVRVVPSTAQNVADHLASQGTGGLGNSAEVRAAGPAGSRPQIASLAPGSAGAVQVLGGLGNAASAAVVGAAQSVNSREYALASCRASDVRGFVGGMWVDVRNSSTAPRAVFSASTTLDSLDSAGNFTLSVTPAWTFANAAAALVSGFRWQVELVGRYVAYRWDGVGSAPSLAGVEEGDYATVTATASPQNAGTFRIVRVRDAEKIFWVENGRAVAEITTASLWFLERDSILPGDAISIGSSVWGAGNEGAWTVESIDSGDDATFKVSVASRATSPVSVPVALNFSAALVQCREGAPSKLVKQVVSISPNPADVALVDVKLASGIGFENVGATYGSSLVALDKLAFPGDLSEGADGYARVVGLLGQAIKVLVGDPTDPATYPGVAAGGAKISVSGPRVRAVAVSLGLRLRTGAARSNVFEAVRAAVAGTFASAGVGESVAISAIIDAAMTVKGVVSVVVLSPNFSATSDLIQAQPQEKLLVLDAERDVSLAIVGG